MKKFDLGWRLLFLAGLFPLIVGSMAYFHYLTHIFSQPADEWIGLLNIPGDVSLEDPTAMAANIRSMYHILSVNLMNTGFIVAYISYFWVRTRSKPGWFAVLIILCWVGGNDSVAFLSKHIVTGFVFPAPLIALALGAIGLGLSYKGVFKTEERT